MRRKVIGLITLFTLLLSGCTTIIEPEQEVEVAMIDWQLYQPDRTMVQYFSGGFENEGFMVVIDKLDDHFMQKKVVSAGAAVYQIYEVYEGFQMLVESNEAGDIASMSDFWEMDYTRGRAATLTEAVDRFTPYVFETTRYDGTKVTNSAKEVEQAFEIDGRSYDILMVETHVPDYNEYLATYYIKGIGQAYVAWMMETDSGELIITFEDRLVNYVPIEPIGSAPPDHITLHLLEMANREGVDIALPIALERFTSDWLLITNPNDAPPKLTHAILDLEGNVIKRLTLDMPKPFTAVRHVASPVPLFGTGLILACDTTDSKGNPIIEIYFFDDRKWQLVDHFIPNPPMSQSELPTVFEFTVNIFGNYMVYANGDRDVNHSDQLIWKVYDRRSQSTIATLSIPEHYMPPSTIDALLEREGSFKIAYDQASGEGFYIEIVTGKIISP